MSKKSKKSKLCRIYSLASCTSLRLKPEISRTLTDVLWEFYRKRIRPLVAWIMKATKEIISKYEKVYLMIDALDECTDTHGRRTDLTANLKKMPENLKILCTSRELSDIKQLFPHAVVIHIHTQESDAEKCLVGQIAKSVRLRKHRQSDASLMPAFVDTVVNRVDGMLVFL